MTEQYISRTRVAAVAAWLAVLGLMLSALLTLFVGNALRMGMILAAAACATSAVAATLSIKIYAMRLCALIRATHGLNGAERPSAGLHSIG